MTKTIPHKAFILAAGYGTRLRPYTDNTPKPLVIVNGKSLLDRTLDHLTKIGINEITLNTHYLADTIKTHMQSRKNVTSHISFEENLLDTGGGIKNMLHHFDDAFYILSGDGLWENAPQINTLKAMANAWNPDIMDILILLQPVSSMHLTKGVGDYNLNDKGLPIRAHNKDGQYMFTSMRINHPRIFDETPDGAFSYLALLDKAQEQSRLHAIVHEGDWHHISTPNDLEAVNDAYKKAGQ